MELPASSAETFPASSISGHCFLGDFSLSSTVGLSTGLTSPATLGRESLPRFAIIFDAFPSLSCTVWHAGHSHVRSGCLTLRSPSAPCSHIRSGCRSECFWQTGESRRESSPSFRTCTQTAFISPKETSEREYARLRFFSMPLTFRSSMAITSAWLSLT